jgi:hypothetical protein
MLNLEYNFSLIRSRYHLYGVIGKCFREDTCYDMLCYMIFQIMSIAVFNSFWLEILCFCKNGDLIKSVQICPNYGIRIIVKPSQLIRLIGSLSARSFLEIGSQL